jgi:hypothetical protein
MRVYWTFILSNLLNKRQWNVGFIDFHYYYCSFVCQTSNFHFCQVASNSGLKTLRLFSRSTLSNECSAIICYSFPAIKAKRCIISLFVAGIIIQGSVFELFLLNQHIAQKVICQDVYAYARRAHTLIIIIN